MLCGSVFRTPSLFLKPGKTVYRETGLRIEGVVECRVVERVNRFVVAVRVDGDIRRAHIVNTGRLHQFLVRDRKGFCTRSADGLRTDFRLFAIEDGDSAAVIDTRLQMNALEESLRLALVPWLTGYRVLKRDARLGGSLIDYLLEGGRERLYLEVKSAVLRDRRYASYPDCPTARGRRHIAELTRYVREGGSAAILFIAALPGVDAFRPNREADPVLYDLLVEAAGAGVSLRAIALAYRPADSTIRLADPDLPVRLT